MLALSTKKTSLVYMSGRGVYFKADCLELLKNIQSNSVSLCFTDPPFNLGKFYANPEFDDIWEEAKYNDWCRTWLSELIRVLKPGGTLAIYCLPKWGIDMGSWLNRRPEITYRSMIAIKMKNGFPIRGRLHPAVYSILYYTKNGAKPTFNVVRHRMPVCRKCGAEMRDYGGYRKKFKKYEDENGLPWIQVSDFWEDTHPARQHKARKNTVNELPLFVPERMILMGSKKDDVVLDIFGGGASTFHAAQMHDRYWIGCDIDPEPALGRFASVWGREEATEIPQKVRECFEPSFIGAQQEVKKEKKVNPVQKVEVPANGELLLRYNVESKSKVLGF